MKKNFDENDNDDDDNDANGAYAVQKRRTGRLSFLSLAESAADPVYTTRAGAFTQVASYRGCVVAVKILGKKHVEACSLSLLIYIRRKY